MGLTWCEKTKSLSGFLIKITSNHNGDHHCMNYFRNKR